MELLTRNPKARSHSIQFMKNSLLFFVFLLPFISIGQGNLVFDGKNTFDGQPLMNTTITVLESGKLIQTLNTGNSNAFKLDLPLGKNYSIFFTNARSQRMFLEVLMADLPKKLLDYKIVYQLSIPFFPKDAGTSLDTTQFKSPFHKVIFNGKDKMVDDTLYMKQFLSKVYLKKKETAEVTGNVPAAVKWTNLAGKFTYSGKEKSPVRNKKVNLTNEKGNVVKTTSTNKYGNFIFTNVDMNDARKIEVDFKKEIAAGQQVAVELSNSKGEMLCTSNVANGKAECQNSAGNKVIEKLIDPRFTYKISAKLINENDKKISFYSNKIVVLLNDRNNVVRRAITNAFGSFVFTDLKPGATYLIGVEKSDVEAGMKVSLYTNSDHFIAPVDSNLTSRYARRFAADNSGIFNDLIINDDQLKMNVKGKLYGNAINNPLGDMKILLLNDKMEAIDTTTTDGFGKFIFKYLPYNKDYSINAFDDKESLLEAINNIHIYSSEDEIIKVVSNFKVKRFKYNPLDADRSKLSEIYADDPWLALMDMDGPAPAANTTIIEDILFESNKSDLLPDAQRTLSKIALVLNSTQGIKIELSAHTDAVGDDAYNQTLSEKRARAAVEYIISKGVPASRIVAKGYGESKIVNRCKNGVFCTDDEHAPNRRIEFKILKN
jgi:outer membrane protein OmpA-like peptidoglycan-associated protein